jgi:acyl-CoA synthetase (AMP-forming)/AMP-acid ligase II
VLLPELTREAATRHGGRSAYVSADGDVTFRDLDAWSDEVAAGFAARGLATGDVVALVLPTAVTYPLAYLAAAKCGLVTAGVNARLAVPEQARLLSLVRPALVITAYDDTPAPEGAEVIRVDGGGRLEELRRSGRRPPPWPADDPDRPVAIVFTSGTTGTPKGAVFGDRQLAAVLRTDVGAAWSQGGASLAGTSLAHLGFMTKLPGHLQAGSTSYLLPRWSARAALELTARHRLPLLSGVPTQLALMLAEPSFADRDLSSVRLVLIGGGPATPALVRAARDRLGAPVCVRYSCTEAGIGLGTRPDDPLEDAETTVGRPQPGVELAVRDADGRDLPVGEVGDVLLRSAAVTSGYWSDEAATRQLFTTDRFVRTGDLGLRDDRGRLRLVGRSTEMYVRGGYNVFPVAVEAALASAPGVRAVAVVPRADEVYGEVGVAVVVPDDPDRAPTLAQLRAHGGGALARHELPEDLRLVDTLPLTTGDKLDRTALRARFG